MVKINRNLMIRSIFDNLTGIALQFAMEMKKL